MTADGGLAAWAAASGRQQAQGEARGGLRFGLGTDDVPVVAGMHDAAALIAGATLVAAEAVMSGRATRAFSVGKSSIRPSQSAARFRSAPI